MDASREAEAVDALQDAATAVGLTATPAPGDARADLVLTTPAGTQVLIEVKRVSLVSADTLARQRTQQPPKYPDPHLLVFIADRVTEDARRLLRDTGGSWLDLRGHLHLAGRNIFVDSDVPSLREAARPPIPLVGHVGQAVAALLLLEPTQPASVRETARRLKRSPSSVSEALAGLREAALIDRQGMPAVPDLFWQLARRWKSTSVDVQNYPMPTTAGVTGSINDALRLGMDDVEGTTGWALTDTIAAAAYGAAVAIRSDHPPDFYVPDQTVMRRAIHLLGEASSHDARAATIRVAPLPLVCACRVDMASQEWPLARPLFVALDLAQDPDRGRAILNDWTPPERVGQRVW